MSPCRSRRESPTRWSTRGTLVQKSFDAHFSARSAFGGQEADLEPGLALSARVAIEEAVVQHRCGIEADSPEAPLRDSRARRELPLARARPAQNQRLHV